jgi:flagellar protein FliO/FliZ
MLHGRGQLKRALFLSLGLLGLTLGLFAQEGAGAESSVPGIDSQGGEPTAPANPSDTADDPGRVPPNEQDLLFDGQARDGAGSNEVSAFGLGDLVRVIFVLALVVGSIYGVFYFLRKLQARRGSGSANIQLLGTQALSANRSVHLIRVGRSVFLVGAGDHSVNLLSEIQDKETVDELILEAPAEPEPAAQSFSDMLTTMFRSDRPSSPAEGGFLRRQAERLKKL